MYFIVFLLYFCVFWCMSATFQSCFVYVRYISQLFGVCRDLWRHVALKNKLLRTCPCIFVHLYPCHRVFVGWFRFLCFRPFLGGHSLSTSSFASTCLPMRLAHAATRSDGTGKFRWQWTTLSTSLPRSAHAHK